MSNIRIVGISCCFVFIFVSLLHLFSQRPLWLDENFVVINIQRYGYFELFRPLDHAQAFPRIHLILIKFFGSLFQYSLISLRLFSFVFMLMAFFVWRRVYARVFGQTWEFALAIVAFTCSFYMSYYAAELKPYSMDVLVVGLYTLLLLNQREWDQRPVDLRMYLWMGLLPLSLFFSYASFFVVWIAGYNMVFLMARNRGLWKPFFLYCSICVGAFVTIYFIDLRYSMAEKALMNYWDSYFICSASFGCFMETLWEGVRRLSTHWFGKGKIFMQWASFLIPLFLYAVIRHGFYDWLRERWKVFTLGSVVAVLFGEMILFGILKKYPFTGDRITLFYAPLVIFCVVRAMADLKIYRYLYFFVVGNFLIFLGVCLSYTIYSYILLYY